MFGAFVCVCICVSVTMSTYRVNIGTKYFCIKEFVKCLVINIFPEILFTQHGEILLNNMLISFFLPPLIICTKYLSGLKYQPCG